MVDISLNTNVPSICDLWMLLEDCWRAAQRWRPMPTDVPAHWTVTLPAAASTYRRPVAAHRGRPCRLQTSSPPCCAPPCRHIALSDWSTLVIDYAHARRDWRGAADADDDADDDNLISEPEISDDFIWMLKVNNDLSYSEFNVQC